jgi:hypothetical protein
MRHAPAPSQTPSVPQLAWPWSAQRPCGSTAPSATLLHVPSVAESEHDWQVPLQFVSQQTPCAQKPVWHSMPSAHVLPRPLSPHEPFVHTAGGAQSASAVQAALHTVPPHLNGKHELDCGVTHAPAPSHEDTGVNAVVCAGHVESLHDVPAWYCWHVPAWHLPFVPQEPAPVSAHRPAGSGAPFATALHVPSVPGSAQDEHSSPQAVSQQTP